MPATEYQLSAGERVHRVVVVDDEQRALGVPTAMDFVTLFAERATR